MTAKQDQQTQTSSASKNASTTKPKPRSRPDPNKPNVVNMRPKTAAGRGMYNTARNSESITVAMATPTMWFVNDVMQWDVPADVIASLLVLAGILASRCQKYFERRDERV